jgi:predicted nucleic acid-binding protein
VVVSAVLDACVLYPIGLRDTLLNLAEAGCYRVLWTEEILTETSRNIVEDTPGLTAEHLDKTFAAMRRAFPEAMVEGYEHLVDSMTNDPKDRHVLAAAVAAEADVIVTLNTRPLPSARLRSARDHGAEPRRLPVRHRDGLAGVGGHGPGGSGRPKAAPGDVHRRDARPPCSPRSPVRRHGEATGANETARR